MERPLDSFVGVELGGGKGKTTAVARLVRTPVGTLEAGADRLQTARARGQG